MLRVFVSLAIAMLVLGMAAPSRAATTIHRDVITDLAVTLVPCGSSDVITLSGRAKDSITESPLPEGGYLIRDTYMAKLSGTSSSGALYQSKIQNQFTEIRIPAGGLTVTAVASTTFIGSGDAPDYAARVVHHLTVRPDGTVAVRFDFETYGCF